MIFSIFWYFQINETILPKNHPGPFHLTKGIDIDSFNQWNNENSPKLKNCSNFSSLLPGSLWIRPKSDYGKFLCLLYRFIGHTQIWDVSTRKKVSRYGVIYYRVPWWKLVYKTGNTMNLSLKKCRVILLGVVSLGDPYFLLWAPYCM